MSMMLSPILVVGHGRSGTTALMAMLASDPAIGLDRVHPYENRHLTYLAKLSLLSERPMSRDVFHAAQMCDFDDDHFGPLPWPVPPSAFNPGPVEWLDALWGFFSERARRHHPGLRGWAEKAPVWVGPLLRERMPTFTLYLFRDPRDVYLSSNAFLKPMGRPQGFGRTPDGTDLDHARNLAHIYLRCFENYRSDRGRADCVLVRYPELVREPGQLSLRLQSVLGLDGIRPVETLAGHSTTTAEESIDRWRREPIPPEVMAFFARHLHEAMAALGYEIASATPAIGIDFAAEDKPLTPRGGWMDLAVERFAAERVREVWLCLRGGSGEVVLGWRQTKREFSDYETIRIPLRQGRHWQVLRFPVGQHPHWPTAVAQMRLLLPGDGREDAPALRWLRLVE